MCYCVPESDSDVHGASQEEVASLQRGLETATTQLQQLQQHNAALEQVCRVTSRCATATGVSTQDKGALQVQLRESQATVEAAQLATQRLDAEHQQVG